MDAAAAFSAATVFSPAALSASDCSSWSRFEIAATRSSRPARIFATSPSTFRSVAATTFSSSAAVRCSIFASSAAVFFRRSLLVASACAAAFFDSATAADAACSLAAASSVSIFFFSCCSCASNRDCKVCDSAAKALLSVASSSPNLACSSVEPVAIWVSIFSRSSSASNSNCRSSESCNSCLAMSTRECMRRETSRESCEYSSAFRFSHTRPNGHAEAASATTNTPITAIRLQASIRMFASRGFPAPHSLCFGGFAGGATRQAQPGEPVSLTREVEAFPALRPAHSSPHGLPDRYTSNRASGATDAGVTISAERMIAARASPPRPPPPTSLSRRCHAPL